MELSSKQKSKNLFTETFSSPKNKSIFTQSATSFTRPNIIWTFSKADRFKEPNRPTKDVPLIDPGSTLSNSSTSLGYGKRYEFKPVLSPPPTITHRELKQSRSKIFQSSPTNIPYSRESWDSHKEIPGPGSYDLHREFRSQNKGVKIKSRTKLLDPVKENPGPDYYSPEREFVQANRYSAIAIGTSRRSDFTKVAQATNPGPGSYEIVSVFDKKSKEYRLRNERKKSNV